jgi:ketosteroid isomerase-like protein
MSRRARFDTLFSARRLAPGKRADRQFDQPAHFEVNPMNTQPFRISRRTLKAAALMLTLALSTSVPALAQQPTTGGQPGQVKVDVANTQPSRTAEVIDRFNQAFVRHDGSLLENLVAEDCVMESVEAASDGSRVVGRIANLKLWQNLANNKDGAFEVEDVVVFGDRANIRWRYRSGPGLSQSVRGVTLMRLRDGLIVEALAYAKTGNSTVGAAVRNASDSRSD